jgi:hypothetical protein
MHSQISYGTTSSLVLKNIETGNGSFGIPLEIFSLLLSDNNKLILLAKIKKL